jgi:hypothetical protein
MSDVARLNIRVTADTAAAMAQLAALDRQLNSMGGSTNNAASAMDNMDQRTNRMSRSTSELTRNQRDSSKALGDMNKLFDNARDLIDKTDRSVMSIKDHDHELALAHDRVTNSWSNWTRELQRSHDEVTRSRQAVDEHTDSVRRFGDSGDNANFRMRSLLITLAAFAITGLAPMLVDATGALGALAATATTAGLVFGAFFLAILPQIKAIGKEFGAVIRNWSESLTSVTQPAVNAWLNVLKANLSTLNPLVEVGATLITRMANAVNTFMQSGEWAKMVASFSDAALNILPAFGRAIGNFLVGFLNMMLAFTPLAGEMNSGLENMSIRFRNWSETLATNTGFQNFVQYVRENGPKMMEVIGQLIEGIGRFVFALAPLGTVVAESIGELVRQIGQLSPDQITIIGTAILTLAAAFQVLKIEAALGWAAALGPTTVVIAAIALVAGAFYLLWTASADLRAAIGEHLIPALRNLWESVQNLWEPVSRIAGAFVGFAGDLLAKFMPVIAQVLNGLANFFNWIATSLDYLVAVWSDRHATMSEKLSATWEFIQFKVKEAWDIIVPLIGKALEWIITKIGEFVHSALEWWDKHHQQVMDAITRFWNEKALPFIKEKMGELVRWLTDDGGPKIIEAMKAVWDKVSEKVKEALAQLVRDLPRLGAELVAAASRLGLDMIAGLFKGAIDAVASGVGDWVKGWGSRLIDGVKGFFGIHSPSTVFAEFGGHMIQGLLNGLINGPDIGKMIGSILGVSGDPLQWLISHIDDVGLALVKKIPELAGLLAKSAPALLAKLAPLGGDVLKSITSVLGSLFGGGSANSEELNGWIATAMGLTGVGPEWFAGISTIIKRESGGNVNAINLTDSNAQAGMPSQGLMQVIPPTFAAYHQAGTSMNILDPIANIAAAINYIKATYGSINNVQQANEALPPAGYAMGTSYATAGLHRVAENGPELVFAGGEKVFTASQTRDMLGGGGGDVFHFDFRGAVISGNQREFQDMVASAMTSLKRDGRM